MRGKDHLIYYFLGSALLAAVCYWVSDLTAGRAHGGPYDVPAVNGVSWFGFLILALAASMLLVVGMLRIVEAMWLRRRDGRRIVEKKSEIDGSRRPPGTK